MRALNRDEKVERELAGAAGRASPSCDVTAAGAAEWLGGGLLSRPLVQEPPRLLPVALVALFMLPTDYYIWLSYKGESHLP